jgi:hypothetical protein
MNKLNLMLAGVALACTAQFAMAQSSSMVVPAASAPPAGDPAYTDQSRLNQTKDPYIKKRVANKEARTEYHAKKKAAKHEYKEEKAAAKDEKRQADEAAAETRRQELKNMRK